MLSRALPAHLVDLCGGRTVIEVEPGKRDLRSRTSLAVAEKTWSPSDLVSFLTRSCWMGLRTLGHLEGLLRR